MIFDKYDSYKDSGLEWLGEIPREWEVKRFNDLFKVSQGLQIIRSERTDNPKINSVEYITLPSIKGTIKEYIYKPTKNVLCNKNDFLVVRTGSGVGQIITNVKGAFHNNFFKVGVNKKLDRKYIYNLLTTYYVKSLMKIYAGITAIPDLNHSEFYSIELALPPLKTQTKIASYLDTQTQKIDKEIQLLEEKSLKYKELKQTLINETVLRGLDKGVKLKDSGIEWIGDIPEGWETERIKNIFNERVGKNLDKKKNEAVTKNILSVMKDIGVINHRDKGNVGNKMAEDITNYKLVYPNDIVVNKMNIMIGSVGISKEFGALSVIYIILITKNDSYAKYYDYFFKMKAFQKSLRKIATGILEIREAVNMTLFMQEQMTKPSYEEQQKIASYLDEKTEKIDSITKTIATKIELLKEFRKTLINDVVTGKVKVCD